MVEKQSQQMKLQNKALRMCEDARAQLILRYPFVGRLGVQIPFIPVNDSRIHTIATNGKVIYIKPEWICKMPPVTMMACVAHTVWTAALCHSFRRGDCDPGKFDLASDLEVCTLLCVENVPRIRLPDLHEMFPKHLPVEEIMAKLPDRKYVRHPDSDIHLYSAGTVLLPESLPGETPGPEKKEQKKKENAENKQNEDAQNEGTPQKFSESIRVAGNSGDTGKDNTQEHSAVGITEYGHDGNVPVEHGDECHEADCECDPAMREVWRQRIIEAGQYYKMIHGSLPGELEQLVNFFANGKTDRIQQLRRYLSLCAKGEAHWLPPARRFVWQGMYLPSRQDPVLDFVVAVDTSGSIPEEDFQRIFSEIINTVNGFRNYRLTLIQCDSAIQDVQEFSSEKPFRKEQPIQLKGRGGTDFKPVFQYLKEKKIQPRVLLYYTDGAGSYPRKKPEYPVLWLLTGDHEVPFGKKIILEK